MSSSNSTNNSQPSLIGGHAEYVKGAAEVRFLRGERAGSSIARRCERLPTSDAHIPFLTGYHRKRDRVAALEELGRAGQGACCGNHESGQRGPRAHPRRLRQGRGGRGQARGMRGYARGGGGKQEVGLGDASPARLGVTPGSPGAAVGTDVPGAVSPVDRHVANALAACLLSQPPIST